VCIILHGPGILSNVAGVWGAYLAATTLAVLIFKFEKASDMLFLWFLTSIIPFSAWLGGPYCLWLSLFTFQILIAARQWQMESEKMKSPNFRLFSINAASVDHWARYVFNILLPLWMCSWDRFATFLCGAMAVSLALSSTHLLSAPPISDDLSYPFKAILDLAQGPLNLAIILLPIFYNTEGNVSLFVSGGVFAACVLFILRSPTVDMDIPRLWYGVLEHILTRNVWTSLALEFGVAVLVDVVYESFPSRVLWMMLALLLGLKSPY
jgi:hypothetical protein